jgi:heat shock protein HslJ
MYRLFFHFLIGVMLVSCATINNNTQVNYSPEAVINRTWQWFTTITPVEKLEVMQPERYTIFLSVDGKLQAKFDCNRGGGNYQISEGILSFGPLFSTRMACPPESQDARFMKDLQRVKSFFIKNNILYLELPYDSGTMQFRPGG